MSISPVGSAHATQPPPYAQNATTNQNKNATNTTATQPPPAPGTGQQVNKMA